MGAMTFFYDLKQRGKIETLTPRSFPWETASHVSSILASSLERAWCQLPVSHPEGGFIVPERPANFDYQTYLASREWSLLREQVRQRSGDRCEHCVYAKQQAVHHLTYARIGKELLADLMAVCNDCHEFLSGKRAYNPLNDYYVVTPAIRPLDRRLPEKTYGEPRHILFPFAVPEGETALSRARPCTETGCIWCTYADESWPIFAHGLELKPAIRSEPARSTSTTQAFTR